MHLTLTAADGSTRTQPDPLITGLLGPAVRARALADGTPSRPSTRSEIQDLAAGPPASSPQNTHLATRL